MSESETSVKARGTALEERMYALERKHGELAERLDVLEMTLKSNTETTNAIKTDTSQIVTLFRASQLGATIVKWCATVGGGAIVAYAAIKGLRS